MNPTFTLSLSALQARLCGTEIDGYVIKRLIGWGGMGAVFEAEHPVLGRRAAVKVLCMAGRNDQQAHGAVKRFLDEATALATVHHPGLVQLLGSGQLPDGTVYLMMELLTGALLRERMTVDKDKGKVPLDRALCMARQIASALCEVHQKGIVHRDLTPSNLVVVADPLAESGERVKLLDFGIAKIRSNLPSPVCTGDCFGTPRYMAPEQCEGSAHINDRADIYTLGLLLFELLSGRSPYDVPSNEAMAWMFAHVSRRPHKLSRLAPALPAEIAQLVDEMLDKIPAQRPSAAQVVMRLRRYEQLARRSGEHPPLVRPTHSRRWTARVLPTVALLACGFITAPAPPPHAPAHRPSASFPTP
jgi:serine/threonine protein kinase